jgi:uncharacterized RDD family membrane protein YckC
VPYCQHCGAQHADDASFCPVCGSWVGSVGGLQPAAPAARYASFWQRVGAWVIDQLVVGIPYNVFSALLLPSNEPKVTSTTDASGRVTLHWSGDWTTFSIVLLVGVVASWLYSAVLQSSSRQATVGKIALNLIVTDEAGNRISFARASGRYFAGILNVLTLGIGYLMVIWTPRKQALHDRLASTVVVRKTTS